MKRIVVGTWAQCMKIIHLSEKMGDNGYDCYALEESSDLEIENAITQEIGKKISFYYESDRWKHHLDGNLFTLTLYRDNKIRQSMKRYNRAMKPLQS